MSNSNLDQRLLNPISNLHHLIVHLLNHLTMLKNPDAVIGYEIPALFPTISMEIDLLLRSNETFKLNLRMKKMI
jgi:hypothetical protein